MVALNNSHFICAVRYCVDLKPLHLLTFLEFKNPSLYICKYRDQVTIIHINNEGKKKNYNFQKASCFLEAWIPLESGKQVNWKQKDFGDEMGQ